MKKLTFLLLVVAGTTLSHKAFSQVKTGQICFVRANGYVGTLVNNKVYIDDSLACKLKNNQYSMHSVAEGKHTVAVDDTGLSIQKRSQPFTVEVVAGKTTYVDIAWADKVFCQEITPESASVKIKKSKENTTCLKSK